MATTIACEVLTLLRERLTIEIDADPFFGYGDDDVVKIRSRLLIDGDVLSESETSFHIPRSVT